MGKILQTWECLSSPGFNLQFYKKQTSKHEQQGIKKTKCKHTSVERNQSSQIDQDKKANQEQLLKYARITHFDLR